MQLLHGDFLDFGSVQLQYTLPRISFWKGDMIKEYIKLDMDDDNYYGKLSVRLSIYWIHVMEKQV